MANEKWSQFFIFSSLDKNRVNGFCKLCQKNYKDRNGSYSNFIKHLKRIHPLEYERNSSSNGAYLSEEANDVIDDRVATDIASVKNKQNEFILSITKNLIIKCGLPLNIVEYASFRDFLKDCHLKFEPVSSRKLKNVAIPSLKNNVLKKIHEALNSASDLTLTIDVWSDRRCRSYLGVTCHFIDEKMTPQAILIDFTRFKSPHTGENILHLTEDVLNRFDLKEKVFKIITDNASSMVKAYKFGLFADEEYGGLEYQTKSISNTNSTSDDFDGK